MSLVRCPSVWDDWCRQCQGLTLRVSETLFPLPRFQPLSLFSLSFPLVTLTWHCLSQTCSVKVMLILHCSLNLPTLAAQVFKTRDVSLCICISPPSPSYTKSKTEHNVPTVFTKTFDIKSYQIVILTNIAAEVYKYCQNAMLQKTIKLITWLASKSLSHKSNVAT